MLATKVSDAPARAGCKEAVNSLDSTSNMDVSEAAAACARSIAGSMLALRELPHAATKSSIAWPNSLVVCCTSGRLSRIARDTACSSGVASLR